MNFIEFLTIYLAIGAAFGAHYYLKQQRSFSISLLLQTFGAILFWIFYIAKFAYVKLLTSADTHKQSVLDLSAEQKIEAAKRDLQTSFINLSINDDSLSYFSFSETIERYVGLSLALQNSTVEAKPIASETETFRVSGSNKQQIEIAGRCQHRKNFLKLQAHQSFARQEMTETLENISRNIASRQENQVAPDINSLEWQEFQRDALSLFETLFDKQTKHLAKSIFDETQKESENAANKRLSTNRKQSVAPATASQSNKGFSMKNSRIF